VQPVHFSRVEVDRRRTAIVYSTQLRANEMEKLNSEDGLDPLADVLDGVRFRSTIFCRSLMTAPWGFSVAGREIATFHYVERGDCWLEVEGTAPAIRLESGDLVLLAHGHAHAVRDAPHSPITALDDLIAGRAVTDGATLRHGGGGPATTLVCGGFFFDDRDAIPFLPALPAVIHLREGGRAGSWLRAAQQVIAGEVEANRVGEGTILGRLSDLIFIEAVRSYFSDASGGPRGWFAALNDRHIGASISLIHRELRKPWTVASLAAAVGMSRSAFAQRFSVLLGESPIQYLARQRIARACSLLGAGASTVAKIADQVGYESDVAFSRAFKRHVGLSPLDYRDAKRAKHNPAERTP
jgi:AraC-like DNA-binding protein